MGVVEADAVYRRNYFEDFRAAMERRREAHEVPVGRANEDPIEVEPADGGSDGKFVPASALAARSGIQLRLEVGKQ